MSAINHQSSFSLRTATTKLATAFVLFCSSVYAAGPLGPTAVKLVLKQQADVSGAFKLSSKQQRGQYVFNALVTTAQQTQPAVLQAISQMGLLSKPYYIANFILVEAPAGQTITSSQLTELSSRSDVSALEAVQTFNSHVPAGKAIGVNHLPPGRGIEKNIEFLNAPVMWAQGAQGQGTTIGIIDSGVQWTHSLLMEHYRGAEGGKINHNYNWWDSIHTTLTSGTNPCGINLQAPCDDLGHGTHVAGVAVGGNGSDYQIGVAPKANFIACRDMDRGYATSGSTFEECLQFMLAPWDLAGENADPTKAPDVVVNPYHCYVAGAGCIDDPVMHTAFWNLYAAGITTVLPSEDDGQVCSKGNGLKTQMYGVAIVTGALDYDASTGQPSHSIASYSGGGPGSASMIFKPSVAGPGTNILSAVPGGNVASMSGTSTAGAHLAGAIALLISDHPKLSGRPEQIWRLIGAVPAVPVTSGMCGSEFATPNSIYGWGKLDVSTMASHAGN